MLAKERMKLPEEMTLPSWLVLTLTSAPYGPTVVVAASTCSSGTLPKAAAKVMVCAAQGQEHRHVY